MLSKPNHNIQFDLGMDRVECADGNKLYLDLILHLSGTSFNQSSIECGGRELASDTSTNVRVHVARTSRGNIELLVRVDSDGKHQHNHETKIEKNRLNVFFILAAIPFRNKKRERVPGITSLRTKADTKKQQAKALASMKKYYRNI